MNQPASRPRKHARTHLQNSASPSPSFGLSGRVSGRPTSFCSITRGEKAARERVRVRKLRTPIYTTTTVLTRLVHTFKAAFLSQREKGARSSYSPARSFSSKKGPHDLSLSLSFSACKVSQLVPILLLLCTTLLKEERKFAYQLVLSFSRPHLSPSLFLFLS